MPELEPVLVSAVEHYSYCPRQCGLIHLESIFDENLYTLKGHRAHERADESTARSEKGMLVLRGLPIWSDEYGLIGKADVVEVLPSPRNHSERRGVWLRPVEYKVGRTVHGKHAAFQAAAQALCLEEMFDTSVEEVVVYFVKTRERVTYSMDELRTETARLIEAVRAMKLNEHLPPPVNDKRCPKCSLIDACQPAAVLSAHDQAFAELFRPARMAELP